MTGPQLPSPKAFARGLALPMLLGAAIADSTPERRLALRDAILPLTEPFKRGEVSWADMRKTVYDQMPAGWQPSGEWAELAKDPYEEDE